MKNETLSGHVLVDIFAGLLILLFAYTATSKLLTWQDFRNVLTRSPLIGNKAPYIAIILPVVELLVSLLLFIPGLPWYCTSVLDLC